MSRYEHHRVAHVARLDESELERVERELAARSSFLTRRGATLVCSLQEGTHVLVTPEPSGHRVEVRRAHHAHWPVLWAAAVCGLVACVAWLAGLASVGFALLGGALSVAATESLWNLFVRYRVSSMSRRLGAALRVRVAEVADHEEHEQVVPVRERVVDE